MYVPDETVDVIYIVKYRERPHVMRYRAYDQWEVLKEKEKETKDE